MALGSRLLCGAFVAVAVTGLSACGGDRNRADEAAGGSPSTTTAATTSSPATTPHVQLPKGPAVSARATDPARRAYIARADRVCARYDPKRNEARKRTGEAADAGEATKAYDEGVKLATAQLRALEAIHVPASEAGVLRANVFEPLHAQLQLRHRIAPALAVNSVAEVRPLQRQLDGLSRSLEGFARGYGFHVCGVG